MSALNNSALIGASGSTGYQISRSVRLRSSASGNFTRTPATTTNQQTFTLSFWSKRGSIGGTDQTLFCFGNGGGSGLAFEVYWGNSNTELVTRTLNIGIAATWEVASSQVFRDPSAWYHIVIAVDTTQATNTNRVKMYANNVQITSFRLSNWPTQNYNTGANTNTQHRIGVRADGVQYLDGYLTEVNFIDGQALTPSSFGETNTVTGVWQPKKYAGTYGTNGFYLNFSDNSGVTATTIGKDYSGNGNNWTPNNISVTAGVTYDSMLDVPTQWADGGNGRGNYCTLNPLNSAATLSSANLNFQGTGAAPRIATGTAECIPSGKTYFEVNIDTVSGAANNSQAGVVPAGISLTDYIGTASGRGYAIEQDGTNAFYLRLNGSTVGPISVTPASGDVMQVAIDIAAGKIWLGRNNTWYNSTGGTTGNPAAGTNETATISTTSSWFPAVQKYNTSGAYSANFGQRPFAYTPPSGFKALNTLNLPTPTILKGELYMNATLWSGDSVNARVITTSLTAVDFAWVKKRNGADDHRLANTVTGGNKHLKSNTTEAESTATTVIQAFSGSTFTLGTDNSVNATGGTYVGWTWRAGAGSSSSNTNGSITSTVSVSPTAGFSVVTYTGTGANATVGHGLGVAPAMLIFKPRNAVDNWPVWHKSFAVNEYVYLNLTNVKASLSTFMNSTLPNSSNITLGTWANTNANTQTMVCYAFAEVAGFSRFGSYTGNGSADGPFVFCGFRPRFFLVKRTDTVESWNIIDTARDPTNQAGLNLYPNLSNAESSNNVCDVLSNGVKLRNTWAGANASGGTYIFAAFAENPFKYSLAR